MVWLEERLATVRAVLTEEGLEVWLDSEQARGWNSSLQGAYSVYLHFYRLYTLDFTEQEVFGGSMDYQDYYQYMMDRYSTTVLLVALIILSALVMIVELVLQIALVIRISTTSCTSNTVSTSNNSSTNLKNITMITNRTSTTSTTSSTSSTSTTSTTNSTRNTSSTK